jgi:hypothetical protein
MKKIYEGAGAKKTIFNPEKIWETNHKNIVPSKGVQVLAPGKGRYFVSFPLQIAFTCSQFIHTISFGQQTHLVTILIFFEILYEHSQSGGIFCNWLRCSLSALI